MSAQVIIAALRRRARALEDYSEGPFLVITVHGEIIPLDPKLAAILRSVLVGEFRALADEAESWESPPPVSFPGGEATS
jgi:hypothetical protein